MSLMCVCRKYGHWKYCCRKYVAVPVNHSHGFSQVTDRFSLVSRRSNKTVTTSLTELWKRIRAIRPLRVITFQRVFFLGIVTLLSAAEILSRMLKSSDFASDIENVLFAFFNGEAFDYIGFVHKLNRTF